MTSQHSLIITIIVLLTFPPFLSHALTQDGIYLLEFKYSILEDPFDALADWNYEDASPCSWNGVICMGFPDHGAQFITTSRVISLVLPNTQLVGSIPAELGLIEHLRHIDLSSNALSGSLPATLFNSTELRILSLAGNEISGEFPELNVTRSSLKLVNISGNALTGNFPSVFSLLPNLTVVSLANNYISGELRGDVFEQLEFLDLSYNTINGSLPVDLGGQKMRFLNLSHNRLSGNIPPELGSRIPMNATVDFSFNNLTGEIPKDGVFAVQKSAAFAGNPDLCGHPLESLCSIPSTLSAPPNSSATDSPPAFAAIPKNTEATVGGGSSSGQGGLRPAVIAAIVIGDLAGIGILFVLFLYVYQVKKRKQESLQASVVAMKKEQPRDSAMAAEIPSESKRLACCWGKKGGEEDETENSSEFSESSDAETHDKLEKGVKSNGLQNQGKQQQGAMLVTVDAEIVLEIDTLLKASAYILGASGPSIVYKAVLQDGTLLAVRRIGESSVIDRFKDFDAQVRGIAKLRHPNLLRVLGFYWGPDEKLLIHDYAPTGSLANISFNKKHGSSPLHLNWETRLRIARGVARGLAYLHDKKCAHGNLKPSNILLDADMEPKIADFGLERLIFAEGSRKVGTSARQFGSKRSMITTSSLPDLSPVAGASPCGSSSTFANVAQYHAPESLKNLKPNVKWDVYSFGMVLLEMITGRVLSEVELCQWNAGFPGEERTQVLRMIDTAIRGELDGKEEAVLSYFKLGFACCASQPQKRPSMKEALQILEKLSSK